MWFRWVSIRAQIDVDTVGYSPARPAAHRDRRVSPSIAGRGNGWVTSSGLRRS